MTLTLVTDRAPHADPGTVATAGDPEVEPTSDPDPQETAPEPADPGEEPPLSTPGAPALGALRRRRAA